MALSDSAGIREIHMRRRWVSCAMESRTPRFSALTVKYALSRKDPTYVPRAKAVREQERQRMNGAALDAEYEAVLRTIRRSFAANSFSVGSAIYDNMPGDGSAREQAASCQKVLGGWANIAIEYATKRYRSNLINWGMAPLLTTAEAAMQFNENDFVFLPGIRAAILAGKEQIEGYIVRGDELISIPLSMAPLTKDEKDILTSGGLINYYSREGV